MSEAPVTPPAQAAFVPPTPAAPVAPVTPVDQLAATADQLEKTAKQLRQERLRAWGGVPITDITVCIGIRDPNGERREVVHQIDSSAYRIVSCQHGVQEKTAAVREEGAIIGFEPTGEFELSLKAKFIKE